MFILFLLLADLVVRTVEVPREELLASTRVSHSQTQAQSVVAPKIRLHSPSVV